MLAEWTAECTADDPTLVVPWKDPAGPAHYIDLRANPYDVAEIPEAEAFPALGRALRALNAQRSPFLTAKCDVWTLSAAGEPEELEQLRFELELDAQDSPAGIGSYIDILWRDRALFASAHQQREMLDRLARRAERLQHPQATLSCVLRPAIYDLEGATVEGFAFSLYVRAVGADAADAVANWESALADVTHLLRGRDLAPNRSSATIDTSAHPQRAGNPQQT